MKRSVTFRDFDTRRMVSYAEYLPESAQLLYADSQWDEQAARRVGRIVLRDVRTGGETVVTDAPGCGNPLLSPDHKKLLYLAAAQGGRQLYIKEENATPRQLTTMRRGVMDPQWSPDGQWIVFTSFAADGESEESLTSPAQGEADDPLAPVVITDFGYKFDGLGFARPEVMQLWVVPADGSR